MKQIEIVTPVNGAAEYQPEKSATGKWMIVMYPSEDPNLGSVVQTGCFSYETARKAANRWQKKENRLVLKHHTPKP